MPSGCSPDVEVESNEPSNAAPRIAITEGDTIWGDRLTDAEYPGTA
jgi:hypothetical protein